MVNTNHTQSVNFKQPLFDVSMKNSMQIEFSIEIHLRESDSQPCVNQLYTFLI